MNFYKNKKKRPEGHILCLSVYKIIKLKDYKCCRSLNDDEYRLFNMTATSEKTFKERMLLPHSHAVSQHMEI